MARSRRRRVEYIVFTAMLSAATCLTACTVRIQFQFNRIDADGPTLLLDGLDGPLPLRED